MDREFDAAVVCQPPRIHEIGKPDSDSRQTHEAVQDRHELRHLRHLNAASSNEADAATDQKRDDQFDVGPLDDAPDRGDQRDRHTDNAVPVAAASRLLVRQPAQGKDEKNGRNDV